MRIVRNCLLGLHIFVGLGGMAGGLAAILDPSAPLGAPSSMLKGSPFDSFLIPGIILFSVIGVGNLASAFCFVFRKRWQGYVSGVSAGALVIWIVVQCVMLRTVVFLHVLFFLIGAAMGCLALALLASERLWPGTWVLRLVTRVSGGK